MKNTHHSVQRTLNAQRIWLFYKAILQKQRERAAVTTTFCSENIKPSRQVAAIGNRRYKEKQWDIRVNYTSRQVTSNGQKAPRKSGRSPNTLCVKTFGGVRKTYRCLEALAEKVEIYCSTIYQRNIYGHVFDCSPCLQAIL